MHRDVRPMTLTYKGKKITFDMPGWYCDQSDESIHTSKDMKVSDRMLNRLKARESGHQQCLDFARSQPRVFGCAQSTAW
jgi:HTH-type transcriptional regulator/antitoxin MqsA